MDFGCHEHDDISLECIHIVGHFDNLGLSNIRLFENLIQL